MNSRKIIGYIKITSIPAGAAPLWVREAWVGLTLPFINSKPYIVGGEDDINTLALGTRRGINCQKLFIIPKEKALEILGAKNKNAAQWFNSYAPACGDFSFGDDELIKIKGGKSEK